MTSRLAAEDLSPMPRGVSRERFLTNITAIVHAVERYLRYGRVCTLDRIRIRRAASDHGEHAATGSDNFISARRSAGMKEQHVPLVACIIEPTDRQSGRSGRRILTRGQHDTDVRLGTERERPRIERAVS